MNVTTVRGDHLSANSSRPKWVLVRTAASGVIGAGHVARTSAVARELSLLGVEVTWMCDTATVPFLRDAGIQNGRIRCISRAATAGRAGEEEAPDSAQADDAQIATKMLCELGGNGLVLVDSYSLGATWQGAIRAAGFPVAAFDDLADRPVVADVVINAAAAPGDYAGLAPHARVLGGLQYAVIAQYGAIVPRLGGRLLVAFGAADVADKTSEVLRALAPIVGSPDRCEVLVQLGAHAAHRKSVSVLVAELGWARLLTSSERIGDPGLGIAIAIGGAGVSLYERMNAGIPSVVIALAKNQARIATAAAIAGSAVIADTPPQAAALAWQLRHDVARLGKMSRAGVSAVDGLGARRIAGSLVACFR